MRIAWCSDPEEFPHYNQRLAGRVAALGHEITVLHRLADLPPDPGASFEVGVLRTRDAPEDPECCEVAARLESAGVPLLNSLAARNASRDKSLAQALFDCAEVPQPEWSLAAAAEDGFEGPVALKPLRGGRGEGIETFATAAEAIACADDPSLFLVQRYFPRAATWRVIATPARAIRGWRIFRLGGIARDRRLAKLRLFVPPPAPVAELARRMVAALGGGMMGADVLVASGAPLALEANTNFYLPLFDRPTVRAFAAEVEARARGVTSGSLR
jgi:glutathione synthase/RimK-type ligase-like ATP-grasp enzyme